MAWDDIARKTQILPNGNWKIWLLLAGRGFGKTRAGAEAINKVISTGNNLSIGLLSETILEAKNIMLNGPSGLLRITNQKYLTHFSDRLIQFNNQTNCYFFGADKYDKLRGFQFHWVWIDEFCKFSNAEQVIEQVFMCLRLGECKMIITTTPRKIKILENLMARSDIIITKGTSYENLHNLSENFRSNLEAYANTEFGQQEIFGEIRDCGLWSKNDIQYKHQQSDYDYYIIGIDPAISKGTTGIIVIGIISEEIHVLLDLSSKETPDKWITEVRNLCEHYINIRIAVEINQGGDLVEHLLKIYNFQVEIIKCRAKNSKVQRALPVLCLYKQNKVFHIQEFTQLEEEMCNFPKDRVDALCWAISVVYNRYHNNVIVI